MVDRKPLTDKVMVIGIDGMDPRMTKKFMDMGILPNVKKLVSLGAARKDLKMMGNVPTITPPMWTTLATGATPTVHGITCFWDQNVEKLDVLEYNLDSRKCKAEPVWNVLVEAGIKTLVCNWPGSSWPPTSENPNLHVIDGTTPGSITSGVATVDREKIIVADNKIEQYAFKPYAPVATGAGCIIKDLEVEKEEAIDTRENALSSSDVVNIVLKHDDGEGAVENMGIDMVNSPFSEPTGWENAPENSKEFYCYFNNGLVRRPALLCCNSKGEYDKVMLYRSKKDIEPMCTIMEKMPAYDIFDKYIINNEELSVYRSFHILNIEPDGSHVRIFTTDAYQTGKRELFHPSELYDKIAENVGYPPAFTPGLSKDPEAIFKAMIPTWGHVGQWQAEAIKYLIKSEGYRAVFSHFHNLDSYGHCFYFWCSQKERSSIPAKVYQDLLKEAYIDADNYIGHYMPLLEEGWTLLVTSDHGLVISEAEEPPYLGDPFGINARIMMDLGYTVLKKDENGNTIKEIDWSKTRAVASRGNQIWINLKNRNEHGIVDIEDKYDLEERIINDLYSYRHEGRRCVSIAMRNKDAAFLGFSGDNVGDILYWVNEGLNRVHGDSLPTTEGKCDSSVSPIFLGAGNGLKSGYECERVIRQIDIAPTISALFGVRMPAQCEGAPVYQILSNEF